MNSRLFLFCFVALSLVAFFHCIEDQIFHGHTHNSNPNGSKRIAIVGAGIGGSSTAFFLREYWRQYINQNDQELEIVVFEKSSGVGGRMDHWDSQNSVIEKGASIWHICNRNIERFVQEFGLRKFRSMDDSEIFSVFDGTDFLLKTSTSKVITIAKMLWRYGLAPSTVRGIAEEVKNKFVSIYKYLDDWNHSFQSVEDMLLSTDLLYLTTVSLSDYLINERQIDPQYVNELVTGVTRINYGQNASEINALAGLVALIGSSDELFSLEGGNKQIINQLLEVAQVNLQLKTIVSEISLSTSDPSHSSSSSFSFSSSSSSSSSHSHSLSSSSSSSSSSGNKKYRVTSTTASSSESESMGSKLMSSSSSTSTSEFDVVVIATPLEFSKISLHDNLLVHNKNLQDLNAQERKFVEKEKQTLFHTRKYKGLYVTIVAAPLNPLYFSLPSSSSSDSSFSFSFSDNSSIPTFITTTESSTAPFLCISKRGVKKFENNEDAPIYKIFSSSELSDQDLSSVFVLPSSSFSDRIQRCRWFAYPMLTPLSVSSTTRSLFQRMVIAEGGVYYVNAFETPFSTMESESISGQNIAKLIIQSFLKSKQ